MPVEKGFGALGRVGFDEARIRVGQVEAEEVDGLPDPADHRDRLAEVDLGVTRGMDEGNEHLPRSGLLLAHVGLHGGVAARIGVLVPQALVDPLGRVALLGRRRAVRLQNAINDRCERIELGAGWRPGAPVTGRHREGQHLAHGLWIDAEAPCGLALAQALNTAGVANPRIQIHRLHPTHPAADPRAGGYEGDGVLLRRSRLPQPAAPVRDFLSAAYTPFTSTR